MSASERFLAYAFSVGDAFVALDGDLRIRSVDGAASWLGLPDAAAAAGRAFTELLAPRDRAVFETTAAMLSNAVRLGPLEVECGADEAKRRPVSLFLSQLPQQRRIHVTVVARSRLWSQPEGGELEKPETFIERLQALAEQVGESGNPLVVTLLKLAQHDQGGDDPADFARHLAALSYGGRTATALGDGRYALVHEGGAGEGGARDLMAKLAEATGARFDSATLPVEGEAGSADAARALVYTVRQFADAERGYDLAALSENYDQALSETEAKIAELRDLLAHRRFTLAYQPIVSLADRKIHHLEALVRFDMRSGSPFELVTFAEQVDMIGEFDTAVLETALSVLDRSALSRGLPSIAVNMSGRSLSAPAFVAELESKLDGYTHLAGQLLIEVTESGHITDLDSLNALLQDIRARGFKVCLDDFGAGLSGFQYLKRLEVDYVKIDGSYVRGAIADPKSRAFLHAMATLCQDLGVKTIGEWVETEAEAAFLADIGVDYGQGFLFGKPSPRLPRGAEMAKAV